MENPFNLPDDKLKELLDAYFDWINRDENEAGYVERERKKAETRRTTLLNKEYISKLNDEELSDEILKYVKELEGPVGIRLGEPRVSGEIEKIRRNIMYLIESEEDPFRKAERILEGDYKIAIFHKAFWSPLFQAKYPELLPNWNNKTDNFLRKIGVDLTKRRISAESKYKKFSEAYSYLKNLDKRFDFYDIDHLTHFGTIIPEGVKLIDNLQFDFNNWVDSEETQELIKDYAKIRNRKDPELWQEEYKWKVLPELNKEFFKEPIRAENILEKINLLQKFNPTTGTFVHFGSLIDLKEIAQEKPEIVSDSLLELFEGDRALHERIDKTIKKLKKEKKDAKIGTPLFGYLFAMYDYNKFPLYKDSIFQSLKKNIGKEMEWKSYTIGMKYQRFQELCLKMGEYLKNSNLLTDIEVNGIKIPVGITALDGQDFFYFLDKQQGVIKDDTRYWRIVLPLDTKEYVVWPTCKEKGLIAVGYLENPKSPDVGKMRDKMKIGDKVIAYLEKGRVGGVGTITGEFEDFSDTKPGDKDLFNGDFWRRRMVKWDYLPEDGEFWQLENNMPGARTTVYELSKEQYDVILKEVDIIPRPAPVPPIDNKKRYTKEKILNEIFISEKEFDEIVKLLKNSKKKQLILQGPPGTGKTFIAQRIARYITQNDNLIETIQFHPSYSYEDFIEGYRPKENGFELSDGIFKQFCTKARSGQDNNYVLIIDEINRGNLSKIFGELLYLLEYRNQRVRLTYSQKEFYLPENLYIIGTMNTADRSLAIMDYALRRRFYFKNINCQTGRLKDWLIENNCQINTDNLLDAINSMNNAIEMAMHCSDYNIGHSYFMREKLDKESLKEIIDFGVEPLLHEYFFDKNEKIKQVISSLENLLRDEEQQNNE